MRFFLSALSWALNLVPQAAASWFGRLMGDVWYAVLRFRRDVVEENLRLAFGKSHSPEQLAELSRANFRHYGQLLVEMLRSVAWTRKDYLRNIKLDGLEHLAPFLRSGTGGFLLGAHLGNWEVAMGAAAAAGIPVDIVVKHGRTPQMEKFLQWYRRKTGAGVFLEEGTMADILLSLSQGRFVAFMFDQFMGPPIGLPVKFFGHEAGTVASLALMTDRREIPIVPVYSYRDEKGNIRGVIEPPLRLPPLSEDKSERLFQRTQFYNDVIERMVRRHPEQWLWLHRRWKQYRGTPRWSPKRVLAPVTSALALWLVAGCTSFGDTPTGIPLPKDPTIAVPRFTEAPPPELVVLNEGQTPAPTPTPTPTPTPEPKKKKKSRKKKAEKPKTETRPVSDYFSVIPSDKVPFEIGEKMEIDLTWMAIPAGRITLEVRDGQSFQGRPTFHLWGNLLSSRVADAIYHVDNTIESYIDKQGFIPYKFLLHMVESAQKKETRVSFDHTQHKAYYWAQRISKKWGDQKEDRADSMRPHARDMFSAVYFARTLNFSLKQKQVFPVYENGQNIDVEMLPVANELLRTKAGVFQTWKILCTVRVNNVLKPTGDVYLWLSDDSKKYIVKFDAKLKIGSLYGNLVSLRERK